MLPIRLITQTLPNPIKDGKPLTNHSDVGWAYLHGLLKAGFTVRAIPSTGMAYGTLETGKWVKLKDAFMTDVLKDAKSFVNVVVGFGGDFEKFWTAGISNIAVTTCWPRLPNAQEIVSLDKYDYILAPFDSDVQALVRAGLGVKLVYPNVEQLTEFFGPLAGLTS